MSRLSRVLLAIASVLLLGAFLFPLWRIDLAAPQYPEGLGMLIRINTVSGIKPNDLANITVGTEITLCTHNPLGVKGCGEVGAIGSPPAVMNAVIDALKEYGIRHIDMPATGAKLWEILQANRPKMAAE